MILEKQIKNKINEIKGEIITSSLVSSDFIFVYSNSDSFTIKTFLLKNKIKGIALLPYLSEENFLKTYSKELISIFNLKTKELDNPLFETLIVDSINQKPIYNTNYYLLSDLMSEKINYEITIKNFNHFLLEHNLLLKENLIKSSLKELLSESIKNNLIDNIDNDNFYPSVIDKFIKKAILSYSLTEIEDYLKNEFEIS